MRTMQQILDTYSTVQTVGNYPIEIIERDNILKAAEEYANQFKQTEQPQKLLPFNLERALAGDEVVMKDGTKVSEFKIFDTATKDEYCVFAVINGRVKSFKKDGSFHYGLENQLFMASKQVTKWVNIETDKNDDEILYTSKQIFFDTEREAIECKDEESCIATVPITFSI